MNYHKTLSLLSPKIFFMTSLCLITCLKLQGSDQKRRDPLGEEIPEIPRRSSAYDKLLEEALRKAQIYGAAQASYDQAMRDHKNDPKEIQKEIDRMNLINSSTEPTFFRSLLRGLGHIASNIAVQVGSGYGLIALQNYARESAEEAKREKITPQMRKIQEQAALETLALQRYMNQEQIKKLRLANLTTQANLIKNTAELQLHPAIMVDPKNPEDIMKQHILKDNIKNAMLGHSFQVGEIAAPQLYQRHHVRPRVPDADESEQQSVMRKDADVQPSSAVATASTADNTVDSAAAAA